MLRLAVVILVVATVVGAVMPGGRTPPDAPAAKPDQRQAIVAGSHRPSQARSLDGEVVLRRAPDGHFYADVEVNGRRITFLVDTGATGIALSTADARTAGLPLLPGLHEVVGKGASGDVTGQHVTLERVSLGHKSASGVAAVVLDGGEQSLLGQSFLARFDRVAIEGDRMVLR